jgi:hypothetical protein
MFKTIISKSLILLSFVTFNSVSGLARNGDCQPQVDMGSLLNNLSVNGGLSVGRLYATCLPVPSKKSQTSYEYHPYDGGKFSSVLKSANGETINTFVWYGEQITGLWELSRYEIVGGANSLKKLNNGNYTLEFAIEDKVFQTFPFSVTTAESKDQFNPKTVYLLDGMWQTYATLYAPKIDRFIQLNVWLRDTKNVGEFKPDPVQYGVKLIREKDKKVLAEGSEKINLAYYWQSYPIHFRQPNLDQTKDYTEFKLSEVTAIDGNYTIEFTLNGKPYSSYKLNVKNGKLNDYDLTQMQKEKYKIIIPLNSGR